MRANELRIGNLIKDEHGLITNIVEITDYDRIAVGNNRVVTDLSNCEPIELTEEWLLKFGFKHTGGGWYIHISSSIQMCNIGDMFFNCGYKDVSIGKIYHVHQLQNIFFALTGKELTIK